ncbi:MAG: glycosyltransferase family 9 protein [Nitrospira sp.]|nr:glycosyltransferase family 9 protein [Nitrospira sp.]
MTIHVPLSVNKRGVLVIHPGALGDVLLARPALSAIRNQFPQHEIALLAGESVGMLLCGAGEVDRVFRLESTYLSELWAGLDSLRSEFKVWLQNCDVAVGWLPDTDGILAATLRVSGVQYTCLKSASSADLHAEHQAARYLAAIQLSGINQMVGTPLVLSPIIREQGRRILEGLIRENRQPVVVIHPGSGSSHKCIEAQRLVPVIDWLLQADMAPLLLEGPSDREAVERVLATIKVDVPVIRGLALSTMAGVLSHAKLYVGHDSGVTHLAAALSVPTIACFGPTDSRRWAPLGRAVSIVSGAPCTCRTWSAVAECRERVCLQIAPERIIEVCRLLLSERRTVPAT